jgi:hypothetical protein
MYIKDKYYEDLKLINPKQIFSSKISCCLYIINMYELNKYKFSKGRRDNRFNLANPLPVTYLLTIQ